MKIACLSKIWFADNVCVKAWQAKKVRAGRADVKQMNRQDIIVLQQVGILGDICILEGYGLTIRVIASGIGIPGWSAGRTIRRGYLRAVEIRDEAVVIFHAESEGR